MGYPKEYSLIYVCAAPKGKWFLSGLAIARKKGIDFEHSGLK